VNKINLPWYCTNSIAGLFPFNHIADEEDFRACLYSPSDDYLSLKSLRDGPSLPLHPIEESNHSLLNNNDLDSDEHYFTTQPMPCNYSTLDSLGPAPVSSKNILTLMHINCRSILGKLNEITNLLEQLSVDILAVSETWLDEPSVDLIHIRGYNFVHRSRTTGRGGGVGLFVKDQLDYQSVELIDNSMHHHSYEALFLRFPQPNGSYFLSGVVYRPHGQDLETFNTEFGHYWMP